MKKSFFKWVKNNLREELPLQIVNSFVYLSDFFLPSFQHSKKTESSKSILIVKTDLLGDFILWANAFKIIAKKFKSDNYKIVILGNNTWVSLAESFGIFDFVLPIDRKKYFKDFSYRKKLLKQLSEYNFEYLIQTSYSRDFSVADSITRNVIAKNKIAFARKKDAEFSFWNILSNHWYTSLITADKSKTFEIFRITEFLSSLGIKIEKYSTDLTEYFPCKNTYENYFIVFPGANALRRCLETEKLSVLIEKIKKQTGWDCYICGAKSEIKLGEKIEKDLNFEVKNLIGKTTLKEVGDLILNAKLVLGNETGTLHYASALNTEAVCFLGGGHFERFMPYNVNITGNKSLPTAVFKKMECYNCNWRCVYVDKKNEVVPCLSILDNEFIWNRIKNIIIDTSKNLPGN